ncbi:hypothetical protein B0H11DRAFT_2244068 [Mycena galericulata]|nr:hypothetical protein B0H11DRAFT_2244068 [Mycena galericulata]
MGWMWDGWQEINDADLIKKAFAGCRAKEWDLSYETLTGFRARQALRDMKRENTPFWNELLTGKIHALEKHNKNYATTKKDPQLAGSSGEEDIYDCEISSRAVKQATMQLAREPLTSENQIAEGLDRDPAEMVGEENVLEPRRMLGNGAESQRLDIRDSGGTETMKTNGRKIALNFYFNCGFSGISFTLLTQILILPRSPPIRSAWGPHPAPAGLARHVIHVVTSPSMNGFDGIPMHTPFNFPMDPVGFSRSHAMSSGFLRLVSGPSKTVGSGPPGFLQLMAVDQNTPTFYYDTLLRDAKYWVAKIKAIRSNSQGDVWVDINWYYAANDNSMLHSLDLKHSDTANYSQYLQRDPSKYERLYSNHSDIISALTFECVVPMTNSLELEHFPIQGLPSASNGSGIFCRYFLDTQNVSAYSVLPLRARQISHNVLGAQTVLSQTGDRPGVCIDSPATPVASAQSPGAVDWVYPLHLQAATAIITDATQDVHDAHSRRPESGATIVSHIPGYGDVLVPRGLQVSVRPHVSSSSEDR